VRTVLLLLGPLVVILVGGYFYFTGGRFIETDNAYVKADVAIVSAQVSGPIATINVHENERVKRGDVLFTIDDRTFQAAKSMYDEAMLNLEHAAVHAPLDGIASKIPTVGQYVAPGAPIMTIVADHDMWIEANYKETELTHVAVGQPVDIELDTYPGRRWHGRVESISQATGAEFSVIPAQNATGNWVKVAQRIPVRIAVEVSSDDPELRAGMSAIVTIDTGYERPAPALVRALLPKRPPPRAVQSVSSARD